MLKPVIIFLLLLTIRTMKISERGEYMIGYFEGFEDTAYWDEYGQVWTIGYGHTRDVSPGDTITKKQPLKLLQQDYEYVENFVNNKKNLFLKLLIKLNLMI